MSGRIADTAFALLLSGALAAVWLWRSPLPAPFDPAEYRLAQGGGGTPRFEQRFIGAEGITPTVHSGTLAALPDGDLLAAWFGGAREGAADVAIYASRWSGARWHAPYVLLDRSRAERELQLHVRKLGNPVLMRDTSDRLWLFCVVVSIGGWSTSSVAYAVSDDGAEHWSPLQRLVTSPFLNISTLVRNRPLNQADGSMALPVYHELIGKFGEWLRLSDDGRILEKSRLSSGRVAIQPAPAATGAYDVDTYLRRVGARPERVLHSASRDAGAHWGPLQATSLPNPDAAVSVQLTPAGERLLVYNHTSLGRGQLDLALSEDGRHWKHLYTLQSGATEDEFSYPFLIRTRAGDYHLIYTWQRRRMAHVRFNDAWLESLR